MKNSKYRMKRCKKGITPYTMAKELGIDYQKYIEVDRGERPLEGKYVDKFNEVLENASEIKFEHAQKMVKVKDFVFNKEEVKKKMKECGVTYASLGDILGFAPITLMNLSNPSRLSSDDLKEIIYDYLNEPMNKKLKDKKIDMPKLVQNMSNNEQKEEDNINIPETEKKVAKSTADVNNDETVADESENQSDDKETIEKLRETNKQLVDDNFKALGKIIDLSNELDKCKHQIKMYEKLIEKL